MPQELTTHHHQMCGRTTFTPPQSVARAALCGLFLLRRSYRQAWYVSDSHALACTHDSMRMDEMKQSEDLAFDRCSPGTFAFANKEDAELFVNQHSGRVQTMEELLEGANPQ